MPRSPRSRKYRVITTLERINRLTRWTLRHGLAPRAFALLETTGRRTGRDAALGRALATRALTIRIDLDP